MIRKFAAVLCAATVFGTSTASAAIAIAVAGLWLIGLVTGIDSAQVASGN
jgi:hypothetical protein